MGIFIQHPYRIGMSNSSSNACEIRDGKKYCCDPRASPVLTQGKFQCKDAQGNLTNPRLQLPIRNWIPVFAFIGVIIVNLLASVLPLNGMDTGAISDLYPNLFTPVDIIIADWVDSVDGNEVSYFDKPISTFTHYPSNRIVYGRDPLSVDKYIARKMGYTDTDSPIMVEEEGFVGNKPFGSEMVVGDDLTKLLTWRKIGSMLNLKAKLQDYIPVNDKAVAWGIRQYAFPILK